MLSLLPVTQIAEAKYLSTNAACAAGEHALRVAGGNSLSAALPIERHFRDARADLFNSPQGDLALAQIARAALAARRAADATPVPARDREQREKGSQR